ncbi:aldo/keto reductase [Streptomyces yaizuensis]|uniref:Oxidoreductase n=1 Tax=Streptomyces yaizuensis TaxID=2989713 RepID=A0ABQ5P232_9ACTN|nr:aldo/keto reductase [Streptomyces sp. YSPA8]GLF96562.1 oxidoreductase [Streptomyces sp. YSPA8]
MSDDFRLGGDLPINRLGLGAMRLPTNGFRGPARDPAVGRAVLRRAVELGVNHIDTAGFYADGSGTVRANDLIREALHPYRPGLVVATKVGPLFGAGGVTEAGPGELRGLVESDRDSLGVDRLDLVYLRVGGPAGTGPGSVAARFEALAALREEGLIRHLGLSNVTAAQLAEARAIAPVAAVQNHFNTARRGDADLLAVCADAGIGFAPFFPLGGGTAGASDAAGGALAPVAARHGATVPQIALAWLLALSPVTLAIAGTGSVAHLEENMAAGTIALTARDLAELS